MKWYLGPLPLSKYPCLQSLTISNSYWSQQNQLGCSYRGNNDAYYSWDCVIPSIPQLSEMEIVKALSKSSLIAESTLNNGSAISQYEEKNYFAIIKIRPHDFLNSYAVKLSHNKSWKLAWKPPSEKGIWINFSGLVTHVTIYTSATFRKSNRYSNNFVPQLEEKVKPVQILLL